MKNMKVQTGYASAAAGTQHRAPGAGFTLIEGIIATGIISTALIVGLALAYSNLTAAQANADRVIAGNLAREGLEVIRNIRDSNWIKRSLNIDADGDGTNGIQFHDWDDLFDVYNYPNGSIKGYVDIRTNPVLGGGVINQYSIAPVPGQQGVPRDLLKCLTDGATNQTNGIECRIQKTTGLLYGYEPNVYWQADYPDDGSALTQFVRRITVKPVCGYIEQEYVQEFDPLDPEGAEPGNYPADVCQNGEKFGNLVISQVMWQRGNKTFEVKVKEKLYNWRNL